MIFKNKSGEFTWSTILVVVLVVIVLMVTIAGPLQAWVKNQKDVDAQKNNLCNLANGMCFVPENDACPDGRTKLTQTGCPQTKDDPPKAQICCQRLATDAVE